jgi:hypothetical protein
VYNNNNNNNSILYCLRAESTAKRPITDTAQSNADIYNTEKKIIIKTIKIIIINSINSVNIFSLRVKK